MSLQVITVSIDKLKSSHDGFQLDGIIHLEVDIVLKRVLTISAPYPDTHFVYDAWTSTKELEALVEGKSLRCWSVEVTFDNQATQTYKYFSLARAQDAYALIRGAL